MHTISQDIPTGRTRRTYSTSFKSEAAIAEAISARDEELAARPSVRYVKATHANLV